MAKFTSKNIEFKDWQKAIFGSSDESDIHWNPDNTELTISTVVSGVDPTDPGHLVTKRHLDASISGGGTNDHGDLTGLGDDDHIQYSLVDGSRGFTSTVSGIYPTDSKHLTTKEYVDNVSGTLHNEIVETESDLIDYVDMVSGTMNHSNLLNLDEDDHLQYIHHDGRRGFTSTVSGINPEADKDLTTRQYVLGIMDGSIPPPTQSGTVVQSLIQFHFADSLAESSTNSTNWVEKLKLTVSGIPIGNYRIAWTFSWRHSKSNTDFAAQIEVDDTTQIFNYIASPYVDTDYWQPITSFYYYDILSSGTHNIDLDYRSSAGGSTSYIKEAKMEFWRIT